MRAWMLLAVHSGLATTTLQTWLPAMLSVGLQSRALNDVEAPSSNMMSDSLEELAVQHGTDKNRDDHGYVQPYSMIMDLMRDRVRNVTEIGVASGASLPMWSSYFPHADVWGIDIKLTEHARLTTKRLQRVRLLAGSQLDPTLPRKYALANESMDVIIDDGLHEPAANIQTMLIYWPLLRPGGFYFVEDIAAGANAEGHYATTQKNGTLYPPHMVDPPGFAKLVHGASTWPQEFAKIYYENDAFFADTLIATRDFKGFMSRMHTQTRRRWMKDRVNHNSHMLVVRKRATPRTGAVTHWRDGAAMRGYYFGGKQTAGKRKGQSYGTRAGSSPQR